MEEFEILHQLGKGSFSQVYLVKRNEDNNLYAIKQIHIANMSNQHKSNALNEVRLLSSLSHQNVIAYKESFYDEHTQTLNIVLEYADGGDLRSHIAMRNKTKRYFKENEIWGIFIQLITGLRYLHSHSIIHRDLKSANVLLTKHNICKIGDLNVSKIAKNGVLHTQTGTPHYASPEIWEEQPYDIKTDIWSVGCILYEMCCLTPPFKGKNLNVVYHNVMKAKIGMIPSFYSRDLITMVYSLLQVEAKDRPSCEEILGHAVIRRKICNIYGQISDWDNSSRNGNCGNNDSDVEMMSTIKISCDKEIKKVLPKKKRYSSCSSNNGRYVKNMNAAMKIKMNRNVIVVNKRNDNNDTCVKNEVSGVNRNKSTNDCNSSSCNNKQQLSLYLQLERIKKIEAYKLKYKQHEDTTTTSHVSKSKVGLQKHNLKRSHCSFTNIILSGHNLINQCKQISNLSKSLSKLEQITDEHKSEVRLLQKRFINKNNYNKPPTPHSSIKIHTELTKTNNESVNNSQLKLTINPFQIMDNPNIHKILPVHMQTKLSKVRHFTNNSTINSSGNNTLEK